MRQAHLAVAEGISRKLGAPRGGEFRRWLRDTIGSLVPTEPTILHALVSLGIPLVTTNYDGLLEAVSELRPITWRQDSLVARFAQMDEAEYVLHLHGHWEDSESVILGVRSYETIQSHQLTQNALRALLLTNTTVFVGYGAGLSDPNFEPLRKWSSAVLHGAEHRHYRLCLAREAQAIATEHLGERIVPLVYGDSYADLVPFLSGLIDRGVGVAAEEREPRGGPSIPSEEVVASGSGPLADATLRQRTWEAFLDLQVELSPLQGPPDQPAPHPVFRVKRVTATEVIFEKVSTQQSVALPLHAVDVPQRIGASHTAQIVEGKLEFIADAREWRYREPGPRL